MSRMLRINSCKTCFNLDHAGAFGPVAYIPWCKLTGNRLPYTPVVGFGNRVQASPTGVIPDNCPLERLPADLVEQA